MTWFSFFRLLHVLTAIFAMGPHFISHLLLKHMQKNPETAPNVLPVLGKVIVLPKHGGPVMLVTGIIMMTMRTGGWAQLQEAWLIAALVLFVLIAAMGIIQAEPSAKKLAQAVARGGFKAGEVAELCRRTASTMTVMGVGLVAIVLLMITRPTF